VSDVGSGRGRHRAVPVVARPVNLQILERAFAILEVFSAERPEWRATEIARELSLPVPTTHRILVALSRMGYTRQDVATRRFRLGSAAIRLAERAQAASDLAAVARDILRRLTESTGETALLTVVSPDRTRGVCLERVETSQPLRLSVQPGRQLPLHAGASQKVLLAYMQADEIDRVASGSLESLCHATITDEELLRHELASIRAQGWASSFEETNIGVWGVAVPVLSPVGIACAVGIAGPSPRLSAGRVRRDLLLVHEAARSVAAAIGLRTPEIATEHISIVAVPERSFG
jgi:IclR family KDG regulon transcriptional repressor